MFVQILPAKRMTNLMQCAERAVGIVAVVPILIRGYCAGQHNDRYNAGLCHIITAGVKADVLMVHQF